MRSLRVFTIASCLLLAAAAAGAQPYYVSGSFLSPPWPTPGSLPALEMKDDGTGGDAVPADGIYTLQVTVAAAGNYEWKAATAGWAQAWPSSGNSWFHTSAADEVVTLTFDTSTHADNWRPTSYWPHSDKTRGTTYTLVGDLGSELGFADWNPAEAGLHMYDDGTNGDAVASDGIYTFRGQISTAGPYQWKVAVNDSWAQQFGADGPTVNANTKTLATTVANQEVTFEVDTNLGRVRNTGSSTSQQVAVTFRMCLARFPTSGTVCVTGDNTELGNWGAGPVASNPNPANPEYYEVTVNFPAGSNPRVEYKWRKDGCNTYEDGDNRLFVINDQNATQTLDVDPFSRRNLNCTDQLAAEATVRFRACLHPDSTVGGSLCVSGTSPQLTDFTTGVAMAQPYPLLDPTYWQADVVWPAGAYRQQEFKFRKNGCVDYEGGLNRFLDILNPPTGVLYFGDDPTACEGLVVGTGPQRPAELSLAQSIPNPMGVEAVIPFSVAEAGQVDLAIYDLVGRKVRTLWSGVLTPGTRSVSWPGIDDAGRPVPNGLYFYRLRTAHGVLQKTLVVMR